MTSRYFRGDGRGEGNWNALSGEAAHRGGFPPAGGRRRLASGDRADRSGEARSRFTVAESEEAETSSCSAQASCCLN